MGRHWDRTRRGCSPSSVPAISRGRRRRRAAPPRSGLGTKWTPREADSGGRDPVKIARMDRRLRSQSWFNDRDNPGMTALYLARYLNYGLTQKELPSGRPIIGIAQTGSDISSEEHTSALQSIMRISYPVFH